MYVHTHARTDWTYEFNRGRFSYTVTSWRNPWALPTSTSDCTSTLPIFSDSEVYRPAPRSTYQVIMCLQLCVIHCWGYVYIYIYTHVQREKHKCTYVYTHADIIHIWPRTKKFWKGPEIMILLNTYDFPTNCGLPPELRVLECWRLVLPSCHDRVSKLLHSAELWSNKRNRFSTHLYMFRWISCYSRTEHRILHICSILM